MRSKEALISGTFSFHIEPFLHRKNRLMRQLFYSFCVGIAFLNPLFSQIDDQGGDWYYGFKAGATYSSIDELATTIIRPIYPEETYNVNFEELLGFTGGVFVYYRFNESSFAIQPEITYGDQGGIFNYDDVNGLEYTIAMKYSYLRLAPIIKIYPVAGLNLELGAQLGFNLNTNNLDYTSNMPELGPDLQIQQSLREVLKGNNNVSFMLGAGYDFPNGLGINLRYAYGISDVIETQANGFYFIENRNPSQSISATLSYAIPFVR